MIKKARINNAERTKSNIYSINDQRIFSLVGDTPPMELIPSQKNPPTSHPTAQKYFQFTLPNKLHRDCAQIFQYTYIEAFKTAQPSTGGPDRQKCLLTLAIIIRQKDPLRSSWRPTNHAPKRPPSLLHLTAIFT